MTIPALSLLFLFFLKNKLKQKHSFLNCKVKSELFHIFFLRDLLKITKQFKLTTFLCGN